MLEERAAKVDSDSARFATRVVCRDATGATGVVCRDAVCRAGVKGRERSMDGACEGARC